VPFLKFTRDKRGYEHFYLVDQGGGRRGKSQRVLFAFRTPPNVKVGRTPFPDEVRKTLEAAYPGISFDWDALMATPIPSAEAEQWRERRRAERAARRQAEAEEPTQEGEEAIESDASPAAPDLVTPADVQPGIVAAPGAPGGGMRKRRRRRRRRGHERPDGTAPNEGQASDSESAGNPDEGV
jgi:hypothetical protein